MFGLSIPQWGAVVTILAVVVGGSIEVGRRRERYRSRGERLAENTTALNESRKRLRVLDARFDAIQAVLRQTLHAIHGLVEEVEQSQTQLRRQQKYVHDIEKRTHDGECPAKGACPWCGEGDVEEVEFDQDIPDPNLIETREDIEEGRWHEGDAGGSSGGPSRGGFSPSGDE